MNSETNPQKQQSKHSQNWLKPEQIDKMKDAAIDNGFLHLRDRNLNLLNVLADTGVRCQELVNLNVDYIDFDSDPFATLNLPSHAQKQWPTGAPPATTIELAPGTARELKRYLNTRPHDSDALFASDQSDRITTRTVENVVKRLAVEAGVRPYRVSGGRGDPDDVSPHTLRHSVAYRVIRTDDPIFGTGGTLDDVQLRLRHSSRATTDSFYSHLVPR